MLKRAKRSKKRSHVLTDIPPHPEVRQSYLDFMTGLDQLTPAWKVDPGSLRDSSNYEIGVSGGYQTIQGYERFDGQSAPSDASYLTLNVTITGTFSEGDTVTGAVSGATGVIVTGGVVTSGAQDYLVLTKVTGVFDEVDENLTVSGIQGNTDAAGVIDGASTTKLHAVYLNAAADVYRADIAAIPGEGRVLGIWRLNDIKYGFRNASGGATAAMYKSTASGWTLVSLGFELAFTSGGTYQIQEDDVITGATSTETATITRVMLESGSWEAGDAAGRLIFASQSGAFQSETLNVGANTNVATIAADSDPISLLPGGRYEFVSSNFANPAQLPRAYGVDTINRGFEFDGTVFCPIDTGMTTDTPNHVYVHHNHLFFAFDGSAQHSGIGKPYIWNAIFGAEELATGDEITGFMREPGSEGNDTLAIYNSNRVNMLYGTSGANWNLVKYREEIGALPRTMQQLRTTFFFGDRGITDIKTAQEFGNFLHATYSRKIQTFINLKKLLTTNSCIARDKNQYRVFFTDGTGLYVTLNRDDEDGVMGMMPVSFPDSVECVFSQETNDKSEEIMFGSDNGMVYQMDKGTSCDGANIDSFFITHFDYQKGLRWLKGFKEITMEATGTAYAEFLFDFDLNYGTTGTPQPDASTVPLDLTDGGRWDTGTWDVGFWDGASITPAMMDLGGSGENISFTIRSSSDYFSPILFSGVYFHYTLRRMLRNNG